MSGQEGRYPVSWFQQACRRAAHAGQLLRRLLGKRGRAGGHGSLAGGRVSLDGLDAPERDALERDIVLRLIHTLRRRKDIELKPLIGTDKASVVCKET